MSSFEIIGLHILEKKNFKCFAIYRCVGHLGHVSMTIFTKCIFTLPMKAPHKIWLWLAKWLQDKDVWSYIYMYAFEYPYHIMQTCPCNIRQFFTGVKTIIAR